MIGSKRRAAKFGGPRSTAEESTFAHEFVKPSVANAAVQEADEPNIVCMTQNPTITPPVVIFLPGTNGVSSHAPMLLLDTIRRQGYRVIYLSYNDQPAATMLCSHQPVGCNAAFRESRSFGGDGPVATPRAEAIVQRLTDLLRHLKHARSGQGWEVYLDDEERPVWSKIILSGLSQGAGMAAYIAKRVLVERVVLFSGPWDSVGPEKRPDPWLSAKSATPPYRWWAERHSRENTTNLIAQAYAALRIPGNQIFLFDGKIPRRKMLGRTNPYHASTVRRPAYVRLWRVMYGRPTAGG